MLISRTLIALSVTLLLTGHAQANDPIVVGGDAYVSGTNATLDAAAGRDAFLSGFAVDVNQRVEKDLGAAGFDVDIRAPVGADAYLAGFSIDVDQAVTEDVSAAGFNIQIRQGATIGGNARLAGGTIAIDGRVAGSLVASGGSLALNAPITGDARLMVGTMTFGPNAKIGGHLTYAAPQQLTIPASVIDPARVTFQQLTNPEGMGKARETLNESIPMVWWTIGGVIFAFAVTIAFLFALAVALQAFMPGRMEAFRQEALSAPVKTMSLGVLGLSASVGLVPVSAMTLIGIPLVPIAILAAIVFWVLGYIIGTYALATRMAEASLASPLSTGARLLVLILGFIILALLNFIPIIGWLINLAVVFLGLGSMAFHAVRAIAREKAPPAAAPVIETAVRVVPTSPPPPRRRARRNRK